MSATPLTRALALIRADPKQRAAYEVGAALTGSTIDRVNAIGAYLLLAETPPEPPPTWTTTEAMALRRRALAYKQEIATQIARIDACASDLDYRDLDPTARAATEGALGVACAKLAALVGGAKC